MYVAREDFSLTYCDLAIREMLDLGYRVCSIEIRIVLCGRQVFKMTRDSQGPWYAIDAFLWQGRVHFSVGRRHDTKNTIRS